MTTVGVSYLCKAFTENKLESLKNDTEKELGFGATTFVVNKGQKVAYSGIPPSQSLSFIQQFI